MTNFRVTSGSIWGGGYSVEVTPEHYVVVEHESCPNAKEANTIGDPPRGFCVVRITKEQSDQFEAAMARFKKYSTPLQDFSFDDLRARPDGKPCRVEVTDSTTITLFWIGTEGARMASFYWGCDEGEFRDLYMAARKVTDSLPIQDIIKER